MKNTFFILFLFFSFSIFAQNSNDDLKLQILKGVFNTHEIKQIMDIKVFETTVWGKHATIPLNNCHPVTVDEGVAAMAFDIFLADDPGDYERMINTGILNLIEGEGFKGGDQRLLQVIYYDTDNDKFLGKGKGFPLKGYPWIQDNLSNWSDLTLINDFSYTILSQIDYSEIVISPYTCILTVNDLDNPEGYGGKHYIFKYHNGKVLTSKGIEGCYESVYEKNKSLIMKIITNCDNHYYEGDPKIIKEELLFKW